MTAYKSDFLNVLASRGYVHQVSDADGLDALAAAGKVVAYVGYDCTAPSLHVGHLLSIMMLHWLQQTSNKPIALMGGGTTRVGDPSGRDERPAPGRAGIAGDIVRRQVSPTAGPVRPRAAGGPHGAGTVHGLVRGWW